MAPSRRTVLATGAAGLVTARRFVGPVLARCLRDGIRIVGNFGAANPRGGGRAHPGDGARAGAARPRIAVVEGDDLTGAAVGRRSWPRAKPAARSCAARPRSSPPIFISALNRSRRRWMQGADIVVTGRVTDSALALGPLIHAFGWKCDDWDRLAAGTLAGHLLECGSQITGGYFADPPFKNVPGMADLGYPIAEIDADGGMVITKPAGTGGRVHRFTVIEQLLYEIHDPSAYCRRHGARYHRRDGRGGGADRVRVTGARGKPAPETLKATVCVDGGVLGEAEISYAGPNAAARGGWPPDHRAQRHHQGDRPASTCGSTPAAWRAASAQGPLASGPRPGDVRLRFAPIENGREVELLLERSRRSIAPARPVVRACASV